MLLVEVTEVLAINGKNEDFQILINMEVVTQIKPLKVGGCQLFFQESGDVAKNNTLIVKESYDMFKQFAMQTVTADDIEKKVKSIKNTQQPTVKLPEIPKL
jgi:hypothetical protein